MEIANSRCLVTGGNSMLGRNISNILRREGAIVDDVPHHTCDLLSHEETRIRFESFRPEYVIHCAGYNGGIAWNESLPATIFERNTRMGLNVLNCASSYKVHKVVNILTSCAYPNLEEPLKEEWFLTSEPHSSVACHAYAKRNLLIYGNQLFKQYGLKVVNVIFNNCLGPRDSFDLKKTKVAGALIRKFIEAKENKNNVIVWGSGNQRRELLFSEDAARGAIEVLKFYDEINLPINIGTGSDVSIKELAFKIKDIVGFEGEIIFDTSKPDGQKRKILDITRMNKYLPNFKADTPLDEALRKTIKWYYENRHLIK